MARAAIEPPAGSSQHKHAHVCNLTADRRRKCSVCHRGYPWLYDEDPVRPHRSRCRSCYREDYLPGAMAVDGE